MLNFPVLQKRNTISNYLQTLWRDINDFDSWKQQKILTAFVHKSYASDFVPSLDHNERLEFLGDAVLGAAVAFLLYTEHSSWSEAQMTLYKIALVREEMLAQVAREIGLGAYIFISHGEEKQWGRNKDAILSDTLEALLGVWYELESFDAVKSFIQKNIVNHLDQLILTDCKSYKSLLQEWSQKQWFSIPQYDTISVASGFQATVKITEDVFWVGVGKNKKKAQEESAKDTYSKII